MKILTEAEILGADDLKKELVSVPEWGGHVYVRTITGAERDQFEMGVAGRNGQASGMSNVRARLCAIAMVDADGKPVMSPAKVTALGKKSAIALGRVFDVATKLNGLSGEDVEELAGNSDADRND